MEMKFLVRSDIIEKLRPRIKKATDLIKKQIELKAPIIIRHHADADGYCGALALEGAILPLIRQKYNKERDVYYAYSRRPSIAPFYAYEDAIKDLTYILNDRGKYEYKKPLVIVVDNGSSEQDILGLQRLKIYDIKIIIIDHHPPSKRVDDKVDVHINSSFENDNYRYSAGMLSCEVAYNIDQKVKNLGFIAATSAYSDKVNGVEAEGYAKIAHKEGFSDDLIKSASEAIDFEAYSLGYIDSRNLVSDMFFGDREKQKEILFMLEKEALKKKEVALVSALRYTHISNTKSKKIAIVPIGAVSPRGEYPYTGKIVGMVHDIHTRDGKPTVTLGISDSMIICRGTKDSGLDVNKTIEKLKSRLPHAQITGGGHALAGSIRFIPAALEEVKNYVFGLIR